MLSTRYKFLRKLYPDTVLLFKEKSGLYFFGDDRKIIKLFPKNFKLSFWLEKMQINYFVVEKFTLVGKMFSSNQYQVFLLKGKLYEMVEEMMREVLS